MNYKAIMRIEAFKWVENVENFNQRLIDKTPRRVMQLLRLNDFKEVKKSKVPQLTHLIDTRWNMAIRFDYNDLSTCIQFWEDYILTNVSPWLDREWKGLNGFIVEKNWKFYLYKVTPNFSKNWDVDIIKNGKSHDGGFQFKVEIEQAIYLLYWGIYR